MTNPNLNSELTIQDPAQVWGVKPVHNSMAASTATDRSGYARAITQDGAVVSAETGGKLRGSSGTAYAEANAALNVPYVYAVDPVSRSQISPYQLQEDSILFFDGVGEVTLAQARGAGFLPPDWMRPGTHPSEVLAQRQSRYENGQTEISTRPFDESQRKQEVHEDLKFDPLADQAVERDYSALVDTTGGMEQMSAIQQIVDSGVIDQRTIGTLASQLRCEPEQLQARIAPIMQAFEQQARAVMSEGGLDSNDVVAWAQENCPGKLKEAMHRHATLRQTSGYAALRQEFVESLADRNPQAALSADLGPGVTQSQVGGKVIVRLPDGSTLGWRSAIRAFGPK